MVGARSSNQQPAAANQAKTHTQCQAPEGKPTPPASTTTATAIATLPLEATEDYHSSHGPPGGWP